MQGCTARNVSAPSVGDAAPASASSRMLPPNFRCQQLHQHRAERTSDQALDAAALQDRLMRRMNLDLGGRQPRAVVVLNGRVGGHLDEYGTQRRRRKNKAAAGRAYEARRVRNARGADTLAVSTNRMADGGTAWTCQACSAENFTDIGRRDANQSHGCTGSTITHSGRSTGPDSEDTAYQSCSVCLQPRKRRPLPDSGGDGVYNAMDGVVYRDDYSGSQEGQQQRITTVTFAQIRGLEELPEPTLTPGEWSAVEAKALARGDEAAPCPICREAFRGERQVILSCSHVFHKASKPCESPIALSYLHLDCQERRGCICLSSFEKFVRVKEERSCPLCRKVDYQKRATRQGAVAWRQLCARRLQCAYRRHRAGQQYRVLLRSHYAAGLGDSLRRRDFLSRQAAEGAGKLAVALGHREDSIDRLFGEFDRSLAFSRQVFGQASTAAPATGDSATTISESWGGDRDNTDRRICATGSSSKPPTEKEKNDTLWTEAWRRAGDRGEDECPICMCPMEPVTPGDSKRDTTDDSEGHLTNSLLFPQPPAEVIGGSVQESGALLAIGVEASRASQHEARTETPPDKGTAVDVGEPSAIASREGEEERMLGRGDRGFQTTESDQRRNNRTAAGGNYGRVSVALSSTSSAAAAAPAGVTPTRGQRKGERRRRRRKMGDCSGSDGGKDGSGKKRERLLLSCSHVFHTTCLRAFETFNIYEVHLCPVCRQSYDSVDPQRPTALCSSRSVIDRRA